MASPVGMPKLGMTMREGKVLAWPQAVGARVAKGAPVVVIETEKAEVEVEASTSGVLRHVYVAAGATVPCGSLLAAIATTMDEPFDVDAFRREYDRPERVAPAPPRAAAPAEPGASMGGRGGEAAITPAARALARRLGIDAAQVPGTGPGRRVTREDVEAWAERRKTLVAVADGVALEVPTQGDGEVVALLPGFGTDVAAFARQVPALAERYRVLGVNPRGVGLSDAPALERYDVALHAADVAAVVGGPTHLVGASLGAAVAIELALARPELVRSLTLITPFVVADARLLAVLEAWVALAAEARPETLARALVPWMFSRELLADDRARERTVRGLAEIAARVAAAPLARTAAGLRAWSGTRGGDLGRILAPTLVVVAGGDLLTPAAHAVADAIPGATRLVVPGAGHAVALEAPEAVTRAILEHVGRVGG
ncbi:MAG: alpha/beta fold hydrolase [Candidatus Binatia bacterium]